MAKDGILEKLQKRVECKKQSIKLFIFKVQYIAQDKGSQLKLVMKGRRGSKV